MLFLKSLLLKNYILWLVSILLLFSVTLQEIAFIQSVVEWQLGEDSGSCRCDVWLHMYSQSNPKTAQLYKSVWPPRRPLRIKMWNPRWRPRYGCDGKLIAKTLIMTIQVLLCYLLHASLGFGTKFTWIVIIKIFAIILLSQPFLGCHLGFHIFFSQWPSWGRTFFLQLDCFWIRFHFFL